MGLAVLCAERAVVGYRFAVLLADDFLTCDGACVTAELVNGDETSGRTQLSVMRVNGPDIFEILRGQAPGAGGEIQSADAINTIAAASQVKAVTLNGQRFDCGALHAIIHLAQLNRLVRGSTPRPSRRRSDAL